MRRRRGRRAVSGLLAILVALLLAPGMDPSSGAERERKSRARHRSELQSRVSKSNLRPKRRGRVLRNMRRAAPDWPAESQPQLLAQGHLDGSGAGSTVVVSVIMVVPGGVSPRYVALDLGADPSLMRYVGHRQTGRGGLIVREAPGVPGLVSVYRSSLETGFDPVETVVHLEFEAVGSGQVPLSLSAVRVLDGHGRDLGATLAVGDLHLD